MWPGAVSSKIVLTHPGPLNHFSDFLFLKAEKRGATTVTNPSHSLVPSHLSHFVHPPECWPRPLNALCHQNTLPPHFNTTAHNNPNSRQDSPTSFKTQTTTIHNTRPFKMNPQFVRNSVITSRSSISDTGWFEVSEEGTTIYFSHILIR